MSTFSIKSKVVTNRDASPPILSNPEVAQGLLKGVLGVEKTTNNASDIGGAGTTIKLITVPSNARLQKLEYAMASLGTSAVDIAVWYPTTIPQGGQNAPAASLGGTLISSSAFVGNLAGVDTGVAWTDGMGKDATPSLTNRLKPLWSMVGLTTDPGIDLDLGFVVRTAVAINGYVGLQATYID
jgi:hypothetical protein